jgi:hypothetical protein
MSPYAHQARPDQTTTAGTLASRDHSRRPVSRSRGGVGGPAEVIASHGTALPPLLSPSQVVAWQRLAGNRAVAGTMTAQRCKSTGTPCDCDGDGESPAAEVVTPVAVQRDVLDDITTASVSPDAVKGLDDGQLDEALRKIRNAMASSPGDAGLQENLKTVLAVKSSRKLQSLAEAGQEVDPASPGFGDWSASLAELTAAGGQPLEDPPVVSVPGDRLLAVDESGQVVLLDPGEAVQLDNELLDQLDKLADAGAGDGDYPAGPQQQVLMWPDGRALITPMMSAGLADLIVAGEPADLDGIVQVVPQTPSWRDVVGASAATGVGAGIFQLGTFPISNFRGVTLPSGSRIRFADPGFGSGWRWGPPPDSRFLTIFNPSNKKYYAWDAHNPVGATPHDFYHVNQRGMASVFSETNHSPIPPDALLGAKGLRFARVGSRVFLVVGIAIDAALLTDSAVRSVEQGTPRPVVAQAIRTIGGWGGAWVGAKLLCVGGAAATVETGPGAVLGCIAGGVLGGFAGYMGADWIADMIDPD